ncbi:MAG: hypothetical protein ACXV4B_04905 [Halobacteriota archaeon]
MLKLRVRITSIIMSNYEFTMKKSFLAGALAVVMLAAVLTAGCTTNPTTTSPTATPTTAGAAQSVSQYLATTMQQLNFTVATPFSLQPSVQAGIAAYNGTVSDNNGTYAVSVQACNNMSTAQAHFDSMRNMFTEQGYTTVQQNATMWSGFNASAQRGAAVEYGTSTLMPYYCMVITGGSVGQALYQQTMWQNMWDDMHRLSGNGYGMGPYMGYGMNANARSQMQQEMQEHMGSGFGGMM